MRDRSWTGLSALGFVLLAGAVLAARDVAAHELVSEVLHGDAVIVSITHVDGTEFSHEQYEIRAPGSEAPFQTGRTDGRGRVVFVPDGAGVWRLRAFSEDGHGLELDLEVDEAGVVVPLGRPLFDRFTRAVVGAALLLGIFALLQFVIRKRS